MIKDKNELEIGAVIINQVGNDTYSYKIVDVKNGYVYTNVGVMPIDFYLDKYNFSIDKGE